MAQLLRIQRGLRLPLKIVQLMLVSSMCWYVRPHRFLSS